MSVSTIAGNIPSPVSVNAKSLPTESEIRSQVLDAYGKTLAYERAEVDAMITADGDIKMDSAPAGAIIARMETLLGRKLPEPSDLRPDQFNSVNNLVKLIVRKLTETEITTPKPTKTVVGTEAGS